MNYPRSYDRGEAYAALSPSEQALLRTPVSSLDVSEDALQGYLHWEIDRGSGLLADFNRMDGQGPLRSLISAYDRQGQAAILDAGCGTGRQLWETLDSLPRRIDASRIVADGISNHDFSQHSRVAPVRLATLIGEINYEVGNLNDMEIPVAAYDVIYSYAVLMHNPAPEHIAYKLWQALKPEGVLYCDTHVDQLGRMAVLEEAVCAEGGEVMSQRGRSSVLERLWGLEDEGTPADRFWLYRVTKP